MGAFVLDELGLRPQFAFSKGTLIFARTFACKSESAQIMYGTKIINKKNHTINDTRINIETTAVNQQIDKYTPIHAYLLVSVDLLTWMVD